MTIRETLLQVEEYTGIGYRPIIDYGEWRVAILRYHPELEPHAINSMQRHDETDEVFVLLDGHCILFLGDGDDAIEDVQPIDMKPLKAYNVKKGAWHTHTLSHDATVLIIENLDTTEANSPTRKLTPEQRGLIQQQTKALWG